MSRILLFQPSLPCPICFPNLNGLPSASSTGSFCFPGSCNHHLCLRRPGKVKLGRGLLMELSTVPKGNEWHLCFQIQCLVQPEVSLPCFHFSYWFYGTCELTKTNGEREQGFQGRRKLWVLQHISAPFCLLSFDNEAWCSLLAAAWHKSKDCFNYSKEGDWLELLFFL